MDWSISIGETLPRREVHDRYGGGWQGGISPSRKLPNSIFIFTNPDAGRQFGYDRHEGLQEDGTYAYTGEGQVGNQEIARGNKSLVDSINDGRAIRLFRTRKTEATYVGAFVLGDPPFRTERIPDTTGALRNGLIFNLAPVDADVSLLPSLLSTIPAEPRLSPWVAPSFEAYTRSASVSSRRLISRAEFQLQADFGAWLMAEGHVVRQLAIPVGDSVLQADLFDETSGRLYEAKRSAARGLIRTAIGQVLDYVHSARGLHPKLRPAILVPTSPAPDLVDLCRELHIFVYARDGHGFVELTSPAELGR